MAEQTRQMRLLISLEDLPYFKKTFPGIKWQAGDTEIKWNANDPEEVAMAKKAFEAYRKKYPKSMAFKVDIHGNKGADNIKEFDPNAEMIICQEWCMKG